MERKIINIRNVNITLWKQFTKRAAEKRLYVHEVIEELIKKWLQK